MGRERCTSMGQSQGNHRADDGRLDDAFGLPDGRALPASSSALQRAAVQHATMQHATMQQSSRRPPQRNQFRQHGGMCARAEAAAAGGRGRVEGILVVLLALLHQLCVLAAAHRSKPTTLRLLSQQANRRNPNERSAQRQH